MRPRVWGVCMGFWLVVACATPRPTPQTVERVWPLPPDPPRIAYVKSLEAPEVSLKPKGFFRKLFESLIGSGEAPPHLIRPFGMFVDSGGILSVTDTGLQVVHRFNLNDGTYRQLFRLSGGRRLLSPTGVTEDREGMVYVADSQLNRIEVFDATGRFQRELMSEGDAVRVAGIAYHSERDAVYVSDSGGHRILLYGRDGRKLGSFGARGKEAGQFNFPTHLAVDSGGLLYVSDTMNFRVQVLNPDGTWVRSIGHLGQTLGSFSKPKGVGVDRHGNVYVVDGLYDTVQIFNPSGDLLLNFGNAGTVEGAFWLPTGVVVDGQDRIYVADTYNARVQVFRLVDASMPLDAQPRSTPIGSDGGVNTTGG